MKNHTGRSFWLTLCTIGLLWALYYLPTLEVGGTPLRRVNLLSEVRQREKPSTQEAALPSVPPPPTSRSAAVRDTNKILDYGDTTGRGMRPFYTALRQRSTLGRPVRIAYFGDSFIEGDILTGHLRSLLQKRYGGTGVGFVDVGTRNPGFRPTVIQHHNGWDSHVAIDSSGYRSSLAGISSAYYTADSAAYTELRLVKRDIAKDTSLVSDLFFRLWGEATVNVSVNGHHLNAFHPSGNGELQHLRAEGNISRVRWHISEADSAVFYGATTEDDTGISLDNFALRGSSGTPLMRLPEAHLNDFNSLHPYDLLILQYGLNVANDKVTDYSYYAKQLRRLIEHLKRAFPQAGILIVGVGDRENKDEEGELRTLRGIKPLIRYQQQVAAQTGVAFWNLYEAMGGEGSIVRMVQAVPPEANRDYTHLNFRGGNRLAQLLFQALTKGEQNFK